MDSTAMKASWGTSTLPIACKAEPWRPQSVFGQQTVAPFHRASLLEIQARLIPQCEHPSIPGSKSHRSETARLHRRVPTFMRFLPLACFLSSFFFRETSPP